MVTRWYSSSISLWSRTSRDFLQRKSIDVNLLHWDKTGPFECADDQLAAILEVVSMQAESASMQRIHQLAYNAGVHAEAALMGTVYDLHSNKIFGYTVSVLWARLMVINMSVGGSHHRCQYQVLPYMSDAQGEHRL